ncbi:MAG: HEAT repeat domain-containing protein [Myxococcota bacterium]
MPSRTRRRRPPSPRPSALTLAFVMLGGCGTPTPNTQPQKAAEQATPTPAETKPQTPTSVATPVPAKPSPHLPVVRDGPPKKAAEALSLMIGGRFDIPLPPELEGILHDRIAQGHRWAAQDLYLVGGIDAVATAMAKTKDDAIVDSLAKSIGLRFRLARNQLEPNEPTAAAKVLTAKLATASDPHPLLSALRDIGPDAGDAARVPVAALLADADTRQDAAATLASLGADETTETLFAHLGDEDADVRIAVAQAIGCSGADVSARLQELLKSEDVRVQETAVRALAHLGPDAAEAVGALTLLLDHSNVELVGHTAHTLGAIGSAAKPALPALHRAAATAKKRSPTADVDLQIAISSIEGNVERPNSCPYPAETP